MDAIEEKRVYGGREGALEVYVASAIGVVRVRVAGDTVGEFGLCDRTPARDIAATGETVAIATDEDVQVLDIERGDREARAAEADANESDETFVGTGFGPAVAVGTHGSDLIAASPDGDVARLPAEADTDSEPHEWEFLEHNGVATVRAIAGGLVGTDSGVYRVHDGELDHAGLSDVRDVSAAGVPLAATADGLYKLGNGWMEALEGSFEIVAADPQTDPGRLTRAHAVSGEAIYGYDADAETWTEYDRSTESIVGIGYGKTVYAVTERGSFLSATPDDSAGPWRSQTIGVGDVTGLAVPRDE
ncbi:HVO_0234 family beta-propeller protein [Natronorubrum sp. DTA28]|uniref:HVO_0234 family beta-propeller protein n=1 Tax=Natronorubrum sp. DTA28 TaxID=3447019 RepID=UPI003F82D7F7